VSIQSFDHFVGAELLRMLHLLDHLGGAGEQRGLHGETQHTQLPTRMNERRGNFIGLFGWTRQDVLSANPSELSYRGPSTRLLAASGRFL
jgi:hypothetical protein